MITNDTTNRGRCAFDPAVVGAVGDMAYCYSTNNGTKDTTNICSADDGAEIDAIIDTSHLCKSSHYTSDSSSKWGIASIVWCDDGAEIDAVDDRAVVPTGDAADTDIAGAGVIDSSGVYAVDNDTCTIPRKQSILFIIVVNNNN